MSNYALQAELSRLQAELAGVERINGELIAEYQSIGDAAKATGFNAPNITHAAKGDVKTYKGYKWRYKE